MAAKAKTEKKVKSKSPKKEVESTPVPESVPESVPDTTLDTTATSPDHTPDEFEVLMQSILDRHETIEKEQKLLRADTKRLCKIFAKKHNKKKKKSANSGNKAPSGFAKPAPISKELCDFLGKDVGSELARTEVTKLLNAYIKQHNLQDEKNKRSINPDKKLQALLKVQKGESVTYFNLQKYMKAHFPKKDTLSVTA